MNTLRTLDVLNEVTTAMIARLEGELARAQRDLERLGRALHNITQERDALQRRITHLEGRADDHT